MRKFIYRTTCIMLMGIGIEAHAHNTVREVFHTGTLSGQIRTGFIYVDPEHTSLSTNYTTAVGGWLKYETAAYNGLSLGAAYYTSHALTGLSGDRDKGRFNEEMADTHHYDILAESYLNYHHGKFNLRIGRQRIDTPYADSDDIRMTPNSFEGVTARYTGEKITLLGAFLTRWQGVDATYNFEDLVEGGEGVAMLAATYHNEKLEGGLWYYYADNTAAVFYGDIADSCTFDNGISLKGALQAARQHEIDHSGIEATLWGTMATLTYKSFTFGLAYNKVWVDESKSYFGGFGGGVGFINMFDMTAGVLSIYHNAEGWKGSLTYDLSSLGIAGLTGEYDYGHFQSDAHHKANEHNFVVHYTPSNQWDLEIVYDLIDDTHKNLLEDETTHAAIDYSMQRVLIRANYNF